MVTALMTRAVVLVIGLCWLYVAEGDSRGTLPVRQRRQHSKHKGNHSSPYHNRVNNKWNGRKSSQNTGEQEDFLFDQSVEQEQGKMSEAVLLLHAMTRQLQALRNQVAGLKFQNHMVYKRLKKMETVCQKPFMPTIASASLKIEPKGCPSDYIWNENTQSCYKFGADRIPWRMAREKCQVDNADLVSIETAREQRFLNEKAKKLPDTRHCNFWTGGTDKGSEGHWYWVGSNKAFSFTNWNHNEPNNGNTDEHCMHMLWIFNWAWNDGRCNYENACYICEIHMPRH